MANFTALNLSFNAGAVAPWHASSAAGAAGSGRKVMTTTVGSTSTSTSWRRNFDGLARGKKAKGQVVVVVEATMIGSGSGSGSGSGKYKGTQMREKQLSEMIEKKVMEAKEVCGEDQNSDECKVAWDEVEEVSQAKADLRLKLEIMHQDPLESFCQENPETDECRLYED